MDPGLTTGSSAVYQRFITKTRSALRSWLLTSVPMPICLCKLSSCKACPGTFKSFANVLPELFPWSANKRNFIQTDVSNPKPGHTSGPSGRGAARRGGKEGRGWVERHAVGSIRPRNNPPSCTPANRSHCPGRLFGKTMGE